MSDAATAPPDEYPPRFVTLPDGRRLSYLDIGDPEAEPMILCHGLPGSRVMGEYLRIPVERSGARLVVPDRPGIGYSDPLPGRSILDWPDDVTALADALHAERFSVVGISAGTPYALACALRLRERLRHVAIIGPLTRLDLPGVMDGMDRTARLVFEIASRSTRLGRLWMRAIEKAARHQPQLVLARQLMSLHGEDRAIAERPAVRRLITADTREAFRQGAATAAEEAALHLEDWGFNPSQIEQRLHIWQGQQDRRHPPAMGRYLAAQAPDAVLHPVPDGGALWAVDHFDEVVRSLADDSGGR